MVPIWTSRKQKMLMKKMDADHVKKNVVYKLDALYKILDTL